MKKTASFTIDKNVLSVNVEAPDNLCEVIGHDRASQLLMSFGIAHWVQSKVKAAYKAKDDDKANQSTRDKAKALVAQVEANEVLNLIDFVPAPKGESKEFLAFKAKWDASTPARKAAYLEFMGMDEKLASETAETVFEQMD